MELAERSNQSMLQRELIREDTKLKTSGKLSGAPNTDNPTKDFESTFKYYVSKIICRS